MASGRGHVLYFLFLLILFVEVTPWTIDLPQVRRYLFEKHEAHKKISKNEYDDFSNSDRAFYSNVHGNSKHNSEENEMYGHYGDMNYAKEFKHQSYMEKKVLEIVHDGSRYLEGLRRSLENYNSFLQQCTRQNMTMVFNITQMAPNMSAPMNSTGQFFNNTAWQMMNATGSMGFNPTGPMGFNPTGPMGFNPTGPMGFNPTGPMGFNSTGSMGFNSTRPGSMTCRQATEASERVRRYVDLAMWATRRLQDIAYSENYQKTDRYEENELILKLAWFLDQLALLTGYEPDYEHNLPRRTTTTPTTSPSPMTLVPQTDQLRDYLIACVKANSSIPATIRCNYPLPLPDFVAQIVGGTTTTMSPMSQNNDIVPLPPADGSAQQSMEILVTADDYRNPRKITKRSPTPEEYFVPIPIHEKPPKPIVDFIVKKLSNLKNIVKIVKKHAVEDFASQVAFQKHLHKRSVDDDTSLLINRLTNKINIKSVDNVDKTNDDSDKLSVDSNESPVKSDESSVKSDKSILKFDETAVKFNESLLKSDESTDKSEELIAKSDELIAKSDELIAKSDESIDKSHGPLVEFISPIHFPVSDVSVVNTKSFKKRSIPSSKIINKLSKWQSTDKINVKSVKKRSADNPLTNLAKYYVKYKVWDNSNPLHAKNNEKPQNFDINNHLQPKSLTKRSLLIKKNSHLRLSKPFQVPHSKNKPKTRQYKQKLTKYLSNVTEKKHKKYGQTHKVFKRSLKYEDMYLPRIPMNPMGDISYYVKNKEGRINNPSLVQAAQVRLGLEQIFATGNLAVIHRYGSNYNPAVPAPFFAGFAKGMADS